MGLSRFMVILTIALVFTLAMVVWFFPSNDDFQTENPFWNGAKDISIGISVKPLASLAGLPSSPAGSTLILIPHLEFTTAELEKLKSFLTQGGTLVIADDYGFGNQVLGYLELEARFSGKPLLDPLSNYQNERFPRIPHLTSSSITGDINSLTFNHATSLTGIEADNILAQSSAFSFLDLNDNQSWDKDEPIGPLPVISRHSLGNGQLILIADPSIFINSMENFDGNDTFIKNIAAVTTSSLFLDQSHLPPSTLQQTKNLLTYTRSAIMTPVGRLGVVLVALTITLMPIWHRRRSIDHGTRETT